MQLYFQNAIYIWKDFHIGLLNSKNPFRKFFFVAFDDAETIVNKSFCRIQAILYFCFLHIVFSMGAKFVSITISRICRKIPFLNFMTAFFGIKSINSMIKWTFGITFWYLKNIFLLRLLLKCSCTNSWSTL